MQLQYGLHFHDEAALLDRLSKGLKKRTQEAVFLIGAPLSAPVTSGTPGVLGVPGIIDLIRSEFKDDPEALVSLDRQLRAALHNQYQSAFLFLQGHRGQKVANEIVRKAVLMARSPDLATVGKDPGLLPTSDDECRLIDEDINGWIINRGAEFLGKLITDYPNQFGKLVLTTNFDPIIEVAIRRAGGSLYRTMLHADGYLGQTEAPGCHVIHLHGYWFGSETLHTALQLKQERPRLKASLAAILKNKLLVVCAYGGWDDVFIDALIEVVNDDGRTQTFYGPFTRLRLNCHNHYSIASHPGSSVGQSLYTRMLTATGFCRTYIRLGNNSRHPLRR